MRDLPLVALALLLLVPISSADPATSGCTPTLAFGTVPSHCWSVLDRPSQPACEDDTLASFAVWGEQWWRTPQVRAFAGDSASETRGACERERAASIGADAVIAWRATGGVRESTYWSYNATAGYSILYNETRVEVSAWTAPTQSVRSGVWYVQRQWPNGACDDAILLESGAPVVPFGTCRLPMLPRSQPLPQ